MTEHPSRSHEIAPNEWLFFNWFLSGTDNQDHAVVDEEFARVLHTGSGLRETLCGHLVVPRSFTVSPGPRCTRCLLFVRASPHHPARPAAHTASRTHRPRLPPRRLCKPPTSTGVAVTPFQQARVDTFH